MRKLLIGIGVGAMLLASPVSAMITAREMLAKADAGDKVVPLILVATGAGFLAANARLKYMGQPMLYCQPGKLTMTGEQSVQMLRSYLVAYPANGSFDGAAVLLAAYQYTFPCAKSPG